MRLTLAWSGLLMAVVLLSGCPKLSTGDSSQNADQDDEEDRSSSGNGNGDNRCAPPNGLYDFQYEFKSGNCSRVFPNALDSVLQTSYERITFVNGRSATQSLCSRESVMATEDCVIEVHRTCSLPSPAIGTYSVTGDLDILDDDSIEGTLRFSVNNLGTGCADEYFARGVPAL